MVGFTGYNSSAYGPDGLRVSKQVGSTTAYYINEGGVPILELNSSGTATAVNTFGPDGLISRSSGGASVFYQFDQSGSTAARLNSAGSVLDYHCSDGFGAPLAALTSSDPYDGYGAQFGYYTDHETGLQLLGQRFYDYKAARFVNRDPIGSGGGWNQYRYCSNSPLTLADPSGEFDYDPQAMMQKARPYVEGYLGCLCATNPMGGVAASMAMHQYDDVSELGIGSGKFAGNPGWCNAGGLLKDALTTASCIPVFPAGEGVAAAANGLRSVAEGAEAATKSAETALVTLNRAKGLAAEQKFLAQLQDAGANAVIYKQRVWTSLGSRFPDIAILDEAGEPIQFFEVKSGAGRYLWLQRAKDLDILNRLRYSNNTDSVSLITLQ